jgi:hypothetical protein
MPATATRSWNGRNDSRKRGSVRTASMKEVTDAS